MPTPRRKPSRAHAADAARPRAPHPTAPHPTAARPGPPTIAALAFDLDGTLVLGAEPLPGAGALLAALAAADVPYLVATNNSSASGRHYVRRLVELGLPVTRAAVLTSNDVTLGQLRASGIERPFLVATREVEQEYRAGGVAPGAEPPDAVVLTFDTTLTYAKLRRAADLILAGLPYLATHPDLVCPTRTGPIPDCGAFAALLRAATGRRPRIMGKPERPMAEAIRARLGVAPDAVAFVGDRLYTDVRMANRHGFQAVLTLTGETGRTDLAGSNDVPDLVVDDLDALHTHLRSLGVLG